jgi:hypothetical protein
VLHRFRAVTPFMNQTVVYTMNQLGNCLIYFIYNGYNSRGLYMDSLLAVPPPKLFESLHIVVR